MFPVSNGLFYTIIISFISFGLKIIGKDYFAISEKIDFFLGQFNSALERKLFVILDEMKWQKKTDVLVEISQESTNEFLSRLN